MSSPRKRTLTDGDSAVKTYNDIYLDARKLLKNAGVEAYSLEARLLLSYAAGKNTAEFQRDMRLFASPEYEAEAVRLLRRRAEGEPVAYITGEWEFLGLPMIVTPATLIPRIDTELIAETTIEFLRGAESPRVLDLCAGTGCIGIAIAKNIAAARVVLADISQEALKIARKNAALNGVSSRVMAVEADALSAPAPILRDFSLLVCNPPYIPSGDIAGLDVSVRSYEPHSALDGGEDGLMFYRSVCEKWAGTLLPGGRIIFECGIGQSEALRALGEAAGLRFIEARKDTLGIDRAIIFEK